MLLDRLCDEIESMIIKKRRYVTDELVEDTLIPLFILKYLCDKGEYTYKEIVDLESINEANIMIFDKKITVNISDINKLLPLIQYEDLNELVNEYLKRYHFGIDIFNNNEKKVCISMDYDDRCYDKSGNTVYITNRFCMRTRKLLWFKFFDLILGINNEYITYDELDISKYKYLYIHDFLPRYRFIRNSDNDIYNIIRNMMNKSNNLNIILHTDYKKISNMNEGWHVLKWLDRVILYDDIDTFLYFKNKTDENVSIINYDRDKVKSIDRLYEIINNNRRIKDILTKTTISNIKDNHYRIGFRLYQNKLVDDIRNINEIVDENTNLIARLNNINGYIEREIDKLINR